MTATVLPNPCVEIHINTVEGGRSFDAGRAPDYIDAANAACDRRDAAIRIPYLSRLIQRTTRQWSECVVETCVAQKSCKGLCRQKVSVLHNSNTETKTNA